MPGLGLGLASGSGAAGAGDALRDLIRQRLEERKFQEQQRDAVARLEEQIAGRKADNEYRRESLSSASEDRRLTRDIALGTQRQAEQNRVRDDAGTKVAKIVGRTMIDPERFS